MSASREKNKAWGEKHPEIAIETPANPKKPSVKTPFL